MARHIVAINRGWGMTVLMIEHDISMVADISDRVLALEFGRRIALAGGRGAGRPQVHAAYIGPEA
jgi:branched-chain amino acid transport system ATP-binding protein